MRRTARTAKRLPMRNCKQQILNQQSSNFFKNSQLLYFDVINQLQVVDPKSIATIISGSIYLAITQSATVYLFLTCFLIAAAIKLIFDFIPGIGIRIRPWHLLGLSLTMTTVLAWQSPASAQFFDALEEAVIDVIDEGDTGIDDGIIETIFAFLRIVVILAFVVGVSVVLTQAFRGNDWVPIANMLSVGLAFVIVIELITNLMLGDDA